MTPQDWKRELLLERIRDFQDAECKACGIFMSAAAAGIASDANKTIELIRECKNAFEDDDFELCEHLCELVEAKWLEDMATLRELLHIADVPIAMPAEAIRHG